MAPYWARQQPYFQMGKGKGSGKAPAHFHSPGYGQQVLAPPTQAVGSADGYTTGTIRRLFVGKGFGFISRDDLPSTSGRGDVFLHFSDLEAGVTSGDLAVGMRMKFKWEASRDSRGPGGRARMVSFEDNHSSPASVTTPPRRAARTGRVYRKDLFLAVQQQLKTAGEYEERRPFGTRSRLGPLPSKIVFPFTIQLPQWYWDAEDERALAEANDAQRVQMMEARLDLENGADLNNGDTFGEDWALQSWSYEEAVAANQRLASSSYHPVQKQWTRDEGLAQFFQPLVLQ
eukprot:s1113_g21.t1